MKESESYQTMKEDLKQKVQDFSNSETVQNMTAELKETLTQVGDQVSRQMRKAIRECPECGAKLPGSARFCSSCGAAQKKETIWEEAEAAPQNPEEAVSLEPVTEPEVPLESDTE